MCFPPGRVVFGWMVSGRFSDEGGGTTTTTRGSSRFLCLRPGGTRLRLSISEKVEIERKKIIGINPAAHAGEWFHPVLPFFLDSTGPVLVAGTDSSVALSVPGAISVFLQPRFTGLSCSQIHKNPSAHARPDSCFLLDGHETRFTLWSDSNKPYREESVTHARTHSTLGIRLENFHHTFRVNRGSRTEELCTARRENLD